ncbi:MAG: tRNA (adenosine(37)-N6)-threonylcarbamoyltransferase complex ATPase subunit type 1 TsaE [Candidatus Rokubacteria bacterium]|nr:tRNA (adenosine(37)-N6)-threonylcarbamoyltransferase complex ATPase subunit type 1 TsaE [Candidatus Rokubacteria bacterium]
MAAAEGASEVAVETVVCRTPAETQALGERIGRALGPGSVIGCMGELGAGKTCFLQGLARGLGVPGAVTSPTFVMVNQYRGRVPVHHLDAYRTRSLTEILDLGVEEMFHGEGVAIIEWADLLRPLLPAHAILVTITGLGDEPREIRIERPPSAR